MPPPALTFAISADYARRTGGWVYDQRVLQGLAGLGWDVRHLTLPAGFPHPTEQARADSAAAFRAMRDGSLVLVDQLCLGVLPEVAAAEAERLRFVMIVHHPLAFEYADRDERMRFAKSETEALRSAAAVLVTSPVTGRTLVADFAVPREKIIVAVPGVDRQPFSRGSPAPVLNLLSVGAVVPRKNHALLISALAGLRHLPWRLTVVGNVERAPQHVGKLRTLIAAHGLAGRVRLAGELPAEKLARLWSQAHLYVAASRHEGYGMAIAEAFAHGLPVVTTYAGAAGGWIGRRGAKVVAEDSVVKLRAALRELIANDTRRAMLRREAIARRRSLPTWEATAAAADRGLKSTIRTRS